jgi:hypothetical protein
MDRVSALNDGKDYRSGELVDRPCQQCLPRWSVVIVNGQIDTL